MHVVAWHAWGPPAANSAWLQEGLAQAADGQCGDHTNETVLRGLTARRGWIPVEDVLANFRDQPDLRAYLQAAAFVRYLLEAYGPAALSELWREGATPDTLLGDRSLATVEQQWRVRVAAGQLPSASQLADIEEMGCGGGPPPPLRANPRIDPTGRGAQIAIRTGFGLPRPAGHAVTLDGNSKSRCPRLSSSSESDTRARLGHRVHESPTVCVRPTRSDRL
jgi:hypothetical protein